MIHSSIPLQGLKSFSIGSSGFHFFSESEFSEGQRGYSVDDTGRSLARSEKGGWQHSWQVIGYEESCGDPIFVDSAAEEVPVFTAIHGVGEWHPTLIGESLASFRECINVLANLAVGRENPVRLAANPIDDLLRKTTIEKIKTLSPNSNLEFWELTMGFY